MRTSIGLLGLLLMALVAAATEDKLETKIKEAYVDCAKELGMDTEKLESANFSQEHDKERNCLDACGLRKLGIMESGKLLKDTMVKLFEENMNGYEEKRTELLEVINACVEDAGTSEDECETAGAFSLCSRKKMQELMKD